MAKKIVSRLAFIQSKCGICLYEKHRYSNSLHNFQWHEVLRTIKYFSDEKGPILSQELCTICLGEPFLPRMDRCGHLFCLCCLIELLRHNTCDLPLTSSPPEAVAALGKVTVLCPFCKDLEIGLSTIKRVTLKRTRPLPQPPEFVSFSLLVKSNKHACPRLAHHYDKGKPSYLPTTGSPLATFVSVTVDTDRHWVMLVQFDINQLEKYREQVPPHSFEIAMSLLREELLHAHDSLHHHAKQCGGGESDESDREEQHEQHQDPADLTPLADRFNLLMPLSGKSDSSGTDKNQLHSLFYQCPHYLGASLLLLDPGTTHAIVDRAARCNRPPPTELRARLAGALSAQPVNRDFLARSRLSQLVEGTTVWLARIDWGTLVCTNISAHNFVRLDQQRTHILEQEQRALRRIERIAKRAADRKHLTLTRRSNPNKSADEIIMEKPRPIITGFNTCTLGIECVAPDDDYPHATSCEHYKEPAPASAGSDGNGDGGDEAHAGTGEPGQGTDSGHDKVTEIEENPARAGCSDDVVSVQQQDPVSGGVALDTADDGTDTVDKHSGSNDETVVKDSGIETGSSDGSTAGTHYRRNSDRESSSSSSSLANAARPSCSSLRKCPSVPHQAASSRTPTFRERMMRRQLDEPRPPELVTNPWEVPRVNPISRFITTYVIEKKTCSQRHEKQLRKKGSGITKATSK